MRLVDSHCHLNAAEFDSDRFNVIARAREAGVVQQVLPAIRAGEWPALRDVCAHVAGLHAAYGMHPMYLSDHRDAHVDLLAHWLRHERPSPSANAGWTISSKVSIAFCSNGISMRSSRWRSSTTCR